MNFKYFVKRNLCIPYFLLILLFCCYLLTGCNAGNTKSMDDMAYGISDIEK